jgi:alpha-amylase/alpha-mannosidase (GH57 family)
MSKVYFAFGIHNHQPVGNFDFVFEDAFNKSYLPFIQMLELHPKIRIALHFTGILLDWIRSHHPELIDLVNKLVRRNQIEMMTGGYYEPILSIIPEDDRIGQIRKLTREVSDLFGYQPEGMWLAERVWEPTLPTTLHRAGVKYTIADDTHFKYAGLTDQELNGYYITEDLGNAVALFPISKRLRYTIPFEDPQATIDYLRGFTSGSEKSVIVFADDGEKFGVWPNTYQHVYRDGAFQRSAEIKSSEGENISANRLLF